MQGYSEDLAYIHDAGYGDFARGAAPGLLRTLRAEGIASGLVVDLGCGSGIWAARLLEAGYEVLGIDISPPMVRLAKKRAPAAKFRVGSLLSAALPGCAAITAIGECINYTFDPGNGRRALEAFFRQVFDALQPGGMFIFDVAEPGQIPGGKRRRVWSQGQDWALLLESTESKRSRTLVRQMTCFRQIGRSWRRSEETHQVRLYHAKSLADDLQQIGFRTRIKRSYGRMRLREATAAVYAIKPE
jgi:SAM-dependent methyltransferase